MSVGERIKTLREENNITQTELAEALKTTKQNIYKYENNIITNIPSDKIEAIASFFNVSPAYIMGWEDDKWYFRNGELKTGYWHEKDIEEEIKQKEMITRATNNTKYIPVFNIDTVNAFSLNSFSKSNFDYYPLICKDKPLKEYIYIVNNTKHNDYKSNMYPLIEENDIILLDYGAEPENGDLTMIELHPGNNFFCRFYKYNDYIEFQFLSKKPIRIQSENEDFSRYEVRGTVKQVIKSI
ncbi:helix-turn-helix domain-containing protein [Ruminococcus sp.]|uniref:helix-turn-helix domain-containing protein n=1 Tax=Ruminococcus sp. TaxID=41978 RepID=UPI001B56CACF|nr:helix-turn-helix domain-containing protein [Ruminococcus sp.]MBP5431597.1 helix-turn-helix domain-containing protein [Ruminococcus sp.]